MNRALLPLTLAALAAGAHAQLVFGNSIYSSTNPGASGAYFFDVTHETARQLWTGSASTGRITGLTTDGSQLYSAASARFGKWTYGSIGSAPTMINGFYRQGSNGLTYATGVSGLAYVASGARTGIYGYTNYNASGGAFVEDGIYQFDPTKTTSGQVNSTLVWRHDDLAYNFEGLCYNPADGLFYGTNNPASGTTSTAGIYTIDAFGTGAVTKYFDYDPAMLAPTGLAIGDGKIWLSGKASAETFLKVESLDMATKTYGTIYAFGGYATGGQSTSIVWAPGAVPEPATLAALGLGALGLLRRRSRRA